MDAVESRLVGLLVLISRTNRMEAVASVVGAESLLALMPVVIKQTPLSPLSTVWSRIGVSAVLGGLLSATGTETVYRNNAGAIAALGALNLTHIASSFESFRHLPAGSAMALLYTYPLWIVLLNWSGTKETIGWISLATVGAGLVSLDKPTGGGPQSDKPTGGPQSVNPSGTGGWGWGLFMGVVMAFTEAAMYTVLRTTGWKNPETSVWAVNASAAIWLALVSFVLPSVATPSGPKETLADTVFLAAFNGLVAFGGYWLRFYAVPRLNPTTYAYLSFTGLLAAFLWGLVFLGEKPGWGAIVGAICIGLSGMGLVG